MKRNVNIIKDLNGNDIVFINDIFFKGKQHIKWKDVENYLKQYIGEIIEITETKDLIYIGADFADEYTGSKYTAGLKGGIAKTKANASSGVPEIVKIAKEKSFKKNLAPKHKKDAKYGWYRYKSRFALPVFDMNGGIIRYNIFHAELIIRHAANGKMYLYDIMNIKRETSTPP